MSAAPALELGAALWPLPVRCGCGHRLPLRLNAEAAGVLRGLLEATSAVSGSMVLATYRCGDCKRVVPLTLADLRLAAAPPALALAAGSA